MRSVPARRVTAVATVVLMALVLGLVSGRLQADPGPPDCDNLCRERQHIYICDATTDRCWDFRLPTCFYCTGPINGRCQVLTSDLNTSKQCSPNGTNRIIIQDDCSEHCECNNTYAFVESRSIVTPNDTDGNAWDHHTCGGKQPPGGPVTP